MKKLVAVVLTAFIMSVSCVNLYPPAPAGQGVCDVSPQVVLCKIFSKVGITAEQADDMLLDATLVPVAAKLMKAEEIRNAIDKVSSWVDKNELTMNGLIKYVVKEADIDPALAMLLSRRLVKLKDVPELGDLILDPVSVEMIKAHLAKQKEQFSWF